MTSNFHLEDEHDELNHLSSFQHDGVRVDITTYYGYDHSGSTTVFTSGNSAYFHADKHCHRLHQDEPSLIRGEERRTLKGMTLEQVLTEAIDPIKPCSDCTMDIQTTAEVAQEYDKIPEACLTLFKPGDKRYTTRVSPDGVSHSSEEVY